MKGKGSIMGMKGMILKEVYRILKDKNRNMSVREIYPILSRNKECRITIERLRQILAWDHLRYDIIQINEKNREGRYCYHYYANW